MLNRLFLLVLVVANFATAELQKTAAIDGTGQTISLLFPDDVVKLMDKMGEWERTLKANGLEVSFLIGAGELRRAALHIEESGPGDVELFVHLHNRTLEPLRIEAALRILKEQGVNVKETINEIFGKRKKLDMFVKDKFGLENGRPYMSEFGTFFDGMGDTSLNQLAFSPAANRLYGTPENLIALSHGRLVYTELHKSRRFTEPQKVEHIKDTYSYYDHTILRMTLRVLRLHLDLALSKNPNRLQMDESFDVPLRGFELFFQDVPKEQIKKFKLDEKYVEQFLKLIRNRPPESAAKALEILKTQFPKTIEIFQELGLDIEALAQEKEFLAVHKHIRYKAALPFVDPSTHEIVSPFSTPEGLSNLLDQAQLKSLKRENVRAIPDWVLKLYSPKLFFFVKNFDQLDFEQKTWALNQYIDALKHFSMPAIKRLAQKETTFREEVFTTLNFVNVEKAPTDKSVTLLDFLEEQFRKTGQQENTLTTKFNRRILDRIQRKALTVIKDSKTPVIAIDIDGTLYLEGARALKLLSQYDAMNGTQYFATATLEDFNDLTPKEESLYRYLGSQIRDFSELARSVETIKTFLEEGMVSEAAWAEDTIDKALSSQIQKWKKRGIEIVILTARSGFERVLKERLAKDGFPDIRVVLNYESERPPKFKSDWIGNFQKQEPDKQIIAFVDNSRPNINKVREEHEDVLVIRAVHDPRQGEALFLLGADDELFTALRGPNTSCKRLLQHYEQ